MYVTYMFLTLFTTCCTLWGSCSRNNVETLVKLQKRAALVILDAKLMTPSADMTKQLNWLPFDKREQYLKCVIIYKAQNLMTPNYITGKFTHEYDGNPNYFLRSTSNLNLKLGKLLTNA